MRGALLDNKDGNKGTGEIVILVICDNNQAISSTVFVYRDITQRE